MLKKLVLNQRRIPVPVPIRTLGEAAHWIESNLIKKDHMITRMELNGIDIDPMALDQPAMAQKPLDELSQLTVQVDSPNEICMQTIDVIKNLCIAIEKSLKPLAVAAWQTLPKDRPEDLDMVISDLELCQNLVEQVFILLEGRPVSLNNLKNLGQALFRHLTKLQAAVTISDWKASAKVLLNEIEPFLRDFSSELGFLQKSIFENVADESLARSKNG